MNAAAKYLQQLIDENGGRVERIEPTTTIENLVEKVPGVVRYLIDKGLPCIVCGQPAWGTLEEMAREKGRSDQEINELIAEMNSRLVRRKLE